MDIYVGIVVASLAVLAATGWATLRVVPAGHHGVVTRGGEQVRSKAGGVVALLPGVEHLHLVATRPPAIDPLDVVGFTHDGVEVQLVVSVRYQVVDPQVSVESAADSRIETADAVERSLHHLIAETDLVDLLAHREEMLQRVVALAPVFLSPIGVELTDIDLIDIEVRAGAQLLHLLTE